MYSNSHLNRENYTLSQFSRTFHDENKNADQSLNSSFNQKNNPFIKVKQVSVIEILQGDQELVQSQSKMPQYNQSSASQNIINSQIHQQNSSHSQESQQFSKIIEEEYSVNKSDYGCEIQVEYSQDYYKETEQEVENVQRRPKQSFTQVMGQLIKKKRKNNIELEYINSKNVWQKKWLGVLFYVSKLLYIAKNCQKLFRATLLTTFQIHLIGDIASDFEQNDNFSKLDLRKILSYSKFNSCITYKTFKNLKKKVRKYISCFQQVLTWIIMSYFKLINKFFSALPLINSQSTFFILWETIIFICSLVNFIYLPFELSFGIKRNLFFQSYLSLLCPIIYMLDIFIKSNTQTFQQGNHLQQHKQIFKEYLTSSFIIDLISLVSLNQKVFTFKGSQLLFFLRIFRSLRIIDIIREFYFSNTYYSGIISLFMLFAGSLFYGHLFACIWYFVGTQNDQGWITFNQLHSEDIYSNYICSYYYAVVTMTTIGYGDITAKTTEERFVMIFLALISCGIFGFTINSIGNILSDFKQKSDMYLTELGKLNKYLTYYQVSTQIQANARKYLKFVHQEKNKDQLSTLQSLNNLSEYLQNQIKMEVISKKLKQINFINDVLKEETIFQLCLQVKEQIYQPEQIILNQNEPQEPAIYIINHGRVQKYSQYDLVAKENSIIVLKEKENFGIIEFLMNKENSNFNYKSKELTSIFSLPLSSFLKIIKQDNESYEKFCYLRDQVIYEQYLSKVNSCCLSCQSKNHTLKQCPCIFYDQRQVSIVKRILKSEKEIQTMKRPTKKKQNSLKLFENVNNKATDFQNDNANQLSQNEFSDITEEEDEDEQEEQQNKQSQDFCLKDKEGVEVEASINLLTQNLLKLNEERDNYISHKTAEVQNEDDCSIKKIASELKPQIMIQPRRHFPYEQQRSEDLKKQNSNLVEQLEDEILKYPQRKMSQSYMQAINIAVQNSSNYIVQTLMQNLKDTQLLLTQNIAQQKAQQKQMIYNRINSKKQEFPSIQNFRKDLSQSLTESVSNIKLAKQFSHTISIVKNKPQNNPIVDFEIKEEELDRQHQFKIYYPKSNYDIIISQVNKSHLQFKIPQILKSLKLKRRDDNYKKLIL